MNFKVGQLWRCRNGDKARIYALDCGGLFPVHGATEKESGIWQTQTWTDRGAFDTGFPKGQDLIEEWFEPKVVAFETIVLAHGLDVPAVCRNELYSLLGKKVLVSVSQIKS